MRRSVLGFCVVLCFAGCASRTPGRVIGGTMLGVGGFALISTYTAAERSGHDQLDRIGAWSMLISGATVLLFNEARSIQDPPPSALSTERIAGADTVSAPPTEDAQLRQLTLQASFAARRGQCAAVRTIADRVGELDATYRRGGFVADASIVACL